MAIIPVTVQTTSSSGLAQTYQAPTTTDSYTVVNGERVFLHVKKSGANACNVTIATPGVVDVDLAVPDRVVSIPANTGDKIIGPFSQASYGTPLTVTFSEITGLTFAAIALAAI